MKKKAESFEELFQELEATVSKLEAGNLPLDDSLALYEQGVQLARRCGEMLDGAELRLKELSPSAEGEAPDPELEFDQEEGSP